MSEAIDKVVTAARAAAVRIAPTIVRTPLVRSAALSARCGGEVSLKLENRQRTGSFKLRGAANRMLTLSAEERARGCVAASSGNHGAAVACAMRELGVRGLIFVPEQTSAKKVEAIRQFGGEVRHFGHDGLDTEQHARAYAEANGMFYVSPYNDPEVVAGQATCGLEIVEQLDELDAVFIAVGGGGLIGGVGSVIRQSFPAARIYACQPEASPVMARSIAAGRILDLPSEPTLSDGTAGGIEAGTITFELVAEVADEFILVTEAQIAAAMRLFMQAQQEVVEGAAGVAIAALLARPELARDSHSVVLVCGGNVSDATLQSIRRHSERRR
jgi:threonine dehydratase